ncbi:MAG TPA: glutamate formimidoyltransferase [Terriglobia bacterium]|nr:glutamate formimidoyltransferase [Terriglobia bacterium]
MKTIVECVPNFSEGRDRGIVDQIADAIRSVPGLSLMDLEMDPDHNRSVITFVGEKEGIAEGALRAVEKATELIDLNRHTGAHPRIGATDVVPFVPVRNVTLEECVSIARAVGSEIASRFAIPVYLYEAAATRPDRVQLENIRKGQFEGLREEIRASVDRLPDFGQAQVHPTAGATVVGARKFLIAYNINLNTADFRIAKQIARAVRFSSGGLRYVKAMGVELKARNLVQVSLNLTDFELTPLHRAFEMVKREAQRFGVSIAGSEIVGLIPGRAIEMAADFYLQVEDFHPELIFENRLAQILETSQELGSMRISEFLAAVARPEGFPGGGSVAALSGALAACLGKMVLGFTLNRKKFETNKDRLESILQQLERHAKAMTQAVDRDSQAYEQVVAAQQLPRATEEETQFRRQKIQAALVVATDVPLEVAGEAHAILECLVELRPISNPNLSSDLNTGIWMALASAQGALENVAVNLKSIRDPAFVERNTRRWEELKNLLRQVCAENC